jgi:hypothetical protein
MDVAELPARRRDILTLPLPLAEGGHVIARVLGRVIILELGDVGDLEDRTVAHIEKVHRTGRWRALHKLERGMVQRQSRTCLEIAYARAV